MAFMSPIKARSHSVYRNNTTGMCQCQVFLGSTRYCCSLEPRLWRLLNRAGIRIDDLPVVLCHFGDIRDHLSTDLHRKGNNNARQTGSKPEDEDISKGGIV